MVAYVYIVLSKGTTHMKKRLISLLFCLVCFSACANKPTYDYPSSFLIKKENLIDYQPGFECSAFASSYVLRHYGENIRGLALFEVMPDKLEHDAGVYPSGITTLFKERGFDASLKTDATIEELKQELSRGAPVIVYIHADVDAPSVHYTHYVPIIGYDEDYFYFAESLEYKVTETDPTLPYNRKTDIQTFERLWSNVDGYYEQPYFLIRQK